MTFSLKNLFTGGQAAHTPATWTQLSARTEQLAGKADALAAAEPLGLASNGGNFSKARSSAMLDLLPLMNDWSERLGLNGIIGAHDAATGVTHIDALRGTADGIAQGGAEGLHSTAATLRELAAFAAHH